MCFGHSEQQIREALEKANDSFHRNTKADLTLAQCNKVLSDAVNTLTNMEKDGKRALKKDQVLKGEIVDACNKLKELQELEKNKVQVSLRFAEEWRKQQTVKNISISRISSDVHQQMPPAKDAPLPIVGSRQPTSTTSGPRLSLDTHEQKPINDAQSLVIGSRRSSGASISSGESFDIPTKIFQAKNASKSSGMGARDEDKSTDNSPGSSTTNLVVPCVVQSADDDSCGPSLRLPGNNAPRFNGNVLSVPFSEQSDNYERSTGVSSIALPRTEHPAEDSDADDQGIFVKNVRPPTISFTPPEPDSRLSDTRQLAFCLGLLQADIEPENILDPVARSWLLITRNEPDEIERLNILASDVVRAFKGEEIKDAKVVAEVACLAPVLDKQLFRELLKEFYSVIDASPLMNFQQLEGIARLIQGADPGYLSSDDLVKILELLSIRLMNTQQQSPENMHQLTLAVAHVLDAMADTKVTDLDREKLHEPLSSYLSGLKESSDPFLVYQAAYAFQALLCVPDDETQAALRRTGKVIEGVSGLVSAVKGLDFFKFIEGLEDIQKGVSGVSNVVDVVKSAYDGVTSLVAGGQEFKESLTKGLSFERKREWYSALRSADVLIRDGELAMFKKLVCEAPCRIDPAFQWGICQRLGEMAANPNWDAVTRQSAIAFLGEIYRNDEMWGQEAGVKQWILNILMQLSGDSSQFLSEAVETCLRELETSDDVKKQLLYRACRENGPVAYPLKVTLPEPTSPSLLDHVQDSDVEGSLRQLRRQRFKKLEKIVYVPPQAKPGLQASDEDCFPLMEKVDEFLSSDQMVFLLLGDSGAGKSTFNRELEHHLWQAYRKSDPIPLHIDLPAIDNPERDMITKQLRMCDFTERQITELKLHRRFILICDGYDESQQTHNLYISNRLNQPGEWSAKMIISCRSEYLGADYQNRFQPGDRTMTSETDPFQEAVIAPFSNDQLGNYIKEYVLIHPSLWDQYAYERVIGLIPSLKELIRNPLLMTLSLDVLPRMVNPAIHPRMVEREDLSDTYITRMVLYDQFIEQWLERGKKRLGEKELSHQARAAFENLDNEGFIRIGIDFLKRLSAAIYREQDGRPIVTYSRLKDKNTWKASFFARDNEKQILRESCPLIRNGNQHRFIHSSLLEYGVALAIFDPRDPPGHSEEGETITSIESPLVWRNFLGDPSILQFLEERAQQEPVFQKQLLSYIEHSKTDEKWRTAALNARTILEKVGVHVQDHGTPLHPLREASKKVSTMASVISELQQGSTGTEAGSSTDPYTLAEQSEQPPQETQNP